MKRVSSSLSDFHDLIKEVDVAGKGKLTIKYGKKFAFAVFFHFSRICNSLKGIFISSLLLFRTCSKHQKGGIKFAEFCNI
jgi:hypothetical protein